MSFCTERSIASTRKRHCCGWCGHYIEPNTECIYVSGCGENGFWSMHIHRECRHAWASIPYDELCDGWFPGEFARGRRDDDFALPPEFTAEGCEVTMILSMQNRDTNSRAQAGVTEVCPHGLGAGDAGTHSREGAGLHGTIL